MAFVDVIDNYGLGQTGSLTDGEGQTVTYTVTDGATTINRNNHGDFSARIPGQGQDAVEVTFDAPIIGASITFEGSDSDEFYSVLVDGVAVDLNVLIASGDATFLNVGPVATHSISTAGTISGGINTDGSIGQIIFNIPITSLGAVGAGSPSNGNFDGIEIGIDDTSFDVVCFANGTLIATDHGPRPIETLQVGDLVRTAGDKSKPIRWIGSRRFRSDILGLREKLRPVRITAGALGHGLPLRDLVVSRQHRILIASKVAKRMFGVTDVLIAAIKLTTLPGIYVDESVTDITYYHILLDDHDVVFAQGTPSESLYAGPEGLKAMPEAAKDEILTIFPQFATLSIQQDTACFVPSGKQQRQLIARHSKNEKQLLELFDQSTLPRV